MTKYACRFRNDDALDVSVAMIQHEAWRSMPGRAVSLVMGLLGIASPAKSGVVTLSCRDAAEKFGMTKNTASMAFRDLERLGFIRRSGPSTWRLTMLPNGREPATCDFARIKKQSAPVSGTHRSENRNANPGNRSGF